jgi:hypothetical protein
MHNVSGQPWLAMLCADRVKHDRWLPLRVYHSMSWVFPLLSIAPQESVQEHLLAGRRIFAQQGFQGPSARGCCLRGRAIGGFVVVRAIEQGEAAR